ncbi:hypothetical protein, partial [Aeromonas caviae]|uniref:hypothetical protein n=1 Tax=Aeromonas caviae TaxID=648 RepID=UPI001CC5B5D7
KAILTIKLTAYHRPISICFVGKKLFLIFNKMFTISPWFDGTTSSNGLVSDENIAIGVFGEPFDYLCRYGGHRNLEI